MNLRLFHSIRLMIPVLVTIAVLPSLLALLYSGFEARNKTLRDAEQETLRMVQSLAVTQERITASAQVMLSSLALVPSVIKLDLPACDELFRKIIKLNPIYTNIILADHDGDIIASAVPHPPLNLADRKHFKDACLTRKFSTGEYIISRTTSEPAFPFSYPLLDTRGHIRAVLIAAIGLKQYRDLFSQKSFTEGSFYGIADHAGLRLFRIPEAGAGFDLGKPIAPLVWDFVKKGGKNGIMFEDGSDGVHRIIAFSRLDLGPDTPAYMYMFVGMPEKALAKNVSDVMFRNAMLTGSTWLLALFLSTVIGRNLILNKIKRLTDAAAQFGVGNFNMPTGLDHNAGELGHVAEAFDQMAGKLRQADMDKDRLQQQLIQAQKMESIGRLAGGVAHDFNNKLSVIIGNVELALDEANSSEPLFEYLTEIRKAAESSTDLTRQLLAFARKQTVKPKVIDMNETIGGMLKMLQRLIGEDIELAWLPGAGLWSIMLDPSQIDQVLANLCVNARDAISGAGKVTIKTCNMVIGNESKPSNTDLIPGDYVVLTVADTGCGMNQEVIANLFEPFFTTKPVGKGTGLGLATVFGIVKQNNGFIEVLSEPGTSSTFILYFPRHQCSESGIQSKREPEPAKGGVETLMLVEDDKDILRLVSRILTRAGYTILSAVTPDEALELAQKHGGPIDLLITDVIMPEMDGLALSKRMQSICPNIKVLFTSGYTADVIAHHGVLDAGVNFISKPFTAKSICIKVRDVLEQ